MAWVQYGGTCLRSAAVSTAPAPSTDTGGLGLATASVLGGVLAYVFFAIGTRHYGADAFAGVAQVWSAWFIGAAVLTFPLQHWVIQRLLTDGHGGAVRAVLPRLTLLVVAFGLAVTAISFAIREELFGRDDLVYPLAAGATIIGSAAMGLTRGGLAGRSRFTATATILATENLVRVAFGVAVVAAGAAVGWYSLAIPFGMVLVFGWPDAVRFEGPPVPGVAAFAFLGNVGGGSVIAQCILTLGPVVLGLTGGTDAEVTALFTALALFRGPYLIALGLGIRLSATLAELTGAGRWDRIARIRHRILGGGLALMALGAAGAAVIAPALLRLVFGDEVDLTRAECAALAAGNLAALTTLGLTFVQMTDGAGRRVLTSWMLALVVGTVTMVAVPFDPLPRVVAAFLACQLAGLAFMALLDETADCR